MNKDLSTFFVYRKGQEKPVIVNAEKVVDVPTAPLTFKTGDETVASFPRVEIQGWEKRPSPR